MKRFNTSIEHTSLHTWCIRLLLAWLGCTMCLYTSCYKGEEAEEESRSTTCQLTVSVFASLGIDKYPAYLLIYDDEGKQVAQCTLTEKRPQQNVELPCRPYHLVAVGGTSSYIIPQTQNLQSLVRLSTNSLPTRPLLMGHADVTLGAATASASLQLVPQTAAVSVQVDCLPSSTRQVKITLKPLYSTIDFAGHYASETEINLPIAQADDSWFTDTYQLFPTQETLTQLHLEVETAEEMRPNYYFTFPPLQAAKTYQISISMAGVDPTSEITYIDDPSLASANDTITLSTFPSSTPALWLGHVLAHFAQTSADEGDLLLLSQNEWIDVPSANHPDTPDEALSIAAQYAEGNDTIGLLAGWTIPSKEEAMLLRSLYEGSATYALNELLNQLSMPTIETNTDKGAVIRYLCNDGEHTFTFASGSSTISKAGSKATYHLRLVKRIHVKRKR